MDGRCGLAHFVPAAEVDNPGIIEGMTDLARRTARREWWLP
jgi:hypothetical protein